LPKPLSVPLEPTKTTHNSPRQWLCVLFGVVAFATVLALSFKMEKPGSAEGIWKFSRLTADSGLAETPALSPDGKLVAYASDNGSEGQTDLYVRHLAGGEPIRLTFDGAGNTTPDFSPDGSRIVFRSNRGEGGIYEIPAFGGQARLVTRKGLNPRFSPDGSQIAYWIGTESVAAALPGSGSVWVLPIVGGKPREVGQSLTSARYPVWAPDGKHLLVVGYSAAKGFDRSAIDWWLVSSNGSDTIRTGMHDAMIRAGMQPHASWRTPVPNIPAPGCWSKRDGTVVFSALLGDAANIWEGNLSPKSGRIGSPLKRLTSGPGNELTPSCWNGEARVFANVETRSDMWLLPLDLDAGKPKGEIERLPAGNSWRENVSIARGGRYLAFASYQSGQQSIWSRDLKTAKEVNISRSQFTERFPVINDSGSHIAFSVYEKGKRSLYASTFEGPPEKLCDGCLRATDWSRDGREVLVFGGDPYQINLLETASRKQTTVIKHPTYPVLYARFSPDERWVSFTVRRELGRGRIMLAPINRANPPAENDWIAIAEAGSDDYANWSSDGNTLYYTSNRDGFNCLWGQRIDARSRRPLGAPFAVQHFHGRFYFGHGGWSAAKDRIAISLMERKGDIWAMSRSAQAQ